MSNYFTSLKGLPSLTIYRNIMEDPVIKAVTRHLQAVSEPNAGIDPIQTYSEVCYLLSKTSNPFTTGIDAWQNHLLDLIFSDVNPFSQSAYTPGADYTVFTEAVRWDLAILRGVFDLSVAEIYENTMSVLQCFYHLSGDTALPAWIAAPPAAQELSVISEGYMKIKEDFAAEPQWDELFEILAQYYSFFGCGIFSGHIAFKWENGALHGISQTDPVKLSELLDYADLRELIIDNTLQFIKGYPANNLLLYGDRGTGKSSTIKALLNEYWLQGLRLVEVPKSQLGDYELITQELRRRNHRFILFVDDLSFEENETDFKALKALLEGGIEERPNNVLIYATSNRRHLIKETFADRKLNDDNSEIRGMDTVQEKLSLADRFGMTVIFPTPDQETFIEIVLGLAAQRQLPVPPAELRQRALKWSVWYNGRSPRSARQFIDNLEGQLAMGKLT